MTDGTGTSKEAGAFLRREVSRMLTDRQIKLFLLVAEDEGISQPELMKRTRTKRNVIRFDLRRLAHGYKRWDGRVFKGFGLITLFYDLNNSRAIVCFLTERGAGVLAGLQNLLEKDGDMTTEGTAARTREAKSGFSTESEARDAYIRGRITYRQLEWEQARMRAIGPSIKA